MATRAVEENVANEGSEKLFPVWWHRCVPRRPQHTFLQVTELLRCVCCPSYFMIARTGLFLRSC